MRMTSQNQNSAQSELTRIRVVPDPILDQYDLESVVKIVTKNDLVMRNCDSVTDDNTKLIL